MLAAILTTLFFSISAVTGSRVARAIGGLEANLWRLSIATLLLGFYAHGFGSHLFGVAFSAFAISGLIGVGLGDITFFQALTRIGPRLTVLLIQCLSVPIGALIEWVWLGTTLTGVQVLCAAVVLGGISMALLAQNSRGPQKTQVALGVCFAVTAAFANGFGAVLSRKAYSLSKAAGQDVDGPTAAYQRILGGLLIAAVVVLIVKLRAVKTHSASEMTSTLKEKYLPIWPWLIANALAGQTFGVSCFQWALKHYPTGIVLPIVAMTPLVTIPFAWYFEGERPCLRSVIGGVIAVGGVIALLSCK